MIDRRRIVGALLSGSIETAGRYYGGMFGRTPCFTSRISIAWLPLLSSWTHRAVLLAGILSLAGLGVQAQQQPVRACRQLTLEGEVREGVEWHAGIGRDAAGLEWLVRMAPVTSQQKTISGWDLAVSPVTDQNYPDAALLASPPYGSLNAREIATTYGMRAQDAVAWSPRHFHFLTAASGLARARPLYQALLDAKTEGAQRQQASAELLKLSTGPAASASGRIDILEAHLVSGSADPAAFAEQWAASLDRIPHTLDPDGGRPTPQGELHSLRFRITLWLPASWRTPAGAKAAPQRCAE